MFSPVCLPGMNSYILLHILVNLIEKVNPPMYNALLTEVNV